MGSQVYGLNLGFCIWGSYAGTIILWVLLSVSAGKLHWSEVWKGSKLCFSSATKSQDRLLNVPAIGAMKSTGSIDKFAVLLLASSFVCY